MLVGFLSDPLSWVKLSDLYFFVMKKGHGWKKLFRVANLLPSHFLVGFVQKRGGDVQVGFGTWLGQVYPRSTLYVTLISP